MPILDNDLLKDHPIFAAYMIKQHTMKEPFSNTDFQRYRESDRNRPL